MSRTRNYASVSIFILFRLVNISKGKRLLVHFLPLSSHSARAEQRASNEKNFRAYSNEEKKRRKRRRRNRNWNKKKKKDSFVYSTNKSSRKLSSARSKISIIMEVSFRVKIFCQPKASVKKRRIRNGESPQIRIESLIDVTRKRKKKKTRRKSISFNKLTTKRWYERKDIALSING